MRTNVCKTRQLYDFLFYSLVGTISKNKVKKNINQMWADLFYTNIVLYL